MVEAFIFDGVRTPFGRYGGNLARVRTDDLAAHPLRVLRERWAQVDWEVAEDVVLGCVNQAGEDNRNVARMAALLAGFPTVVAGVTVNRLCGSGLDAVLTAAAQIRAHGGGLMLAGGVESMSRAPWVVGKPDRAFSRSPEIADSTIGWRFVNPALAAAQGTDSMPETAENVAEACDVSRADQDAFAWRSQMRAEAARAAGWFAGEIAPLTLPEARGIVEADEQPRPDATPAALAKLPTPFRSPGTVTAGNASGINDGACALLLADEATGRRQGLTPRGRIVAGAVAGVEPRLMGLGPVLAVRRLLARTGLSLGDIDVIELNEAFAAQALAVLRELGLADDAAHVNPHGGAIALGHPLGASGARLALTALRALEAGGGRWAIVTLCVGVGQGIAALIERV